MTWLDKLLAMRKASGMSLDELSRASGVPKGTLAKITSGATRDPKLETIRQLVDRIIDQQVADGYFAGCPITFKDVSIAKDVIVASLKTIYHARISYPTMEQEQT